MVNLGQPAIMTSMSIDNEGREGFKLIFRFNMMVAFDKHLGLTPLIPRANFHFYLWIIFRESSGLGRSNLFHLQEH